jgi:Na+/glutamate symporter
MWTNQPPKPSPTGITRLPKATASDLRIPAESSRIFFVMTFFTIGVVSDFRKLWEEGIGRLALVYVLCLFGFVIWVALAISWLFFHGIRPPLA